MTLSYSVVAYYITLILCYSFSYSLITEVLFYSLCFIIRLHRYITYNYFILLSINFLNLVYIYPYC